MLYQIKNSRVSREESDKMKIPKKIQKILDRREKLAFDLISLECELDNWLESKGVNLGDPDISEAVLSGCMIYTEPDSAKSQVEDYIKNNM